MTCHRRSHAGFFYLCYHAGFQMLCVLEHFGFLISAGDGQLVPAAPAVTHPCSALLGLGPCHVFAPLSASFPSLWQNAWRRQAKGKKTDHGSWFPNSVYGQPALLLQSRTETGKQWQQRGLLTSWEVGEREGVGTSCSLQCILSLQWPPAQCHSPAPHLATQQWFYLLKKYLDPAVSE